MYTLVFIGEHRENIARLADLYGVKVKRINGERDKKVVLEDIEAALVEFKS